ncbi:MAG UNVERIFIED_CONTAM: hypothetical protein LVR18_30380 [Planctomycetaceae bacterium]|jgi:hypothetical protein
MAEADSDASVIGAGEVIENCCSQGRSDHQRGFCGLPRFPANLLPDAPHFNPGLALQTLSELAADKDTKPVFDGLRAFVQNLNATLIITLGNHDLELAAPTVQRHLLDLIVRQDHDARQRHSLRAG